MAEPLYNYHIQTCLAPEVPPADPVEAFRWAHPGARQVPRSVLTASRLEQAKIGAVLIRDRAHELTDEIEIDNLARARRREAEQAIAERYAAAGNRAGRWDLVELADSLKRCRQSGTVGVHGDGYVVCWDHKCGVVRLCPDEAREEQRRLVERYVSFIQEWQAARPGRRIQYAVLTMHNFRPGRLAEGKRALFERFNEWRKQFPVIAGALVCQEDPLSARGDWNIHLNVILMLTGPFDWAAAREAWGCNVHFQQVRPANLAGSVLELVKYATQLTAEKSLEHYKEGASDAPPMVEWDDDLLIEWWDAQQGFRRVRSYGAIYAIDRKRWDAMSVGRRAELVAACGRHYGRVSYEVVDRPWLELTDWEKAQLRKAMLQPDPLDLDKVTWCGTIRYSEGWGGYLVDLLPPWPSEGVDLIPGDNFSGGRAETGPDPGGGPPWGPDQGPGGAGAAIH